MGALIGQRRLERDPFGRRAKRLSGNVPVAVVAGMEIFVDDRPGGSLLRFRDLALQVTDQYRSAGAEGLRLFTGLRDAQLEPGIERIGGIFCGDIAQVFVQSRQRTRRGRTAVGKRSLSDLRPPGGCEQTRLEALQPLLLRDSGGMDQYRLQLRLCRLESVHSRLEPLGSFDRRQMVARTLQIAGERIVVFGGDRIELVVMAARADPRRVPGRSSRRHRSDCRSARPRLPEDLPANVCPRRTRRNWSRSATR